MKALSIRQPWAWAILHAGKRIENRSRATTYRGEILLHVSKGCTQRDLNAGIDLIEQASGRKLGSFAIRDLADMTRRGGIVGRARIVDCVVASHSPWFVGPFGWVLADVEPLPFVACKGALGLFDVPDEIVRTREVRA